MTSQWTLNGKLYLMLQAGSQPQHHFWEEMKKEEEENRQRTFFISSLFFLSSCCFFQSFLMMLWWFWRFSSCRCFLCFSSLQCKKNFHFLFFSHNPFFFWLHFKVSSSRFVGNWKNEKKASKLQKSKNFFSCFQFAEKFTLESGRDEKGKSPTEA